jgi:hypothetical protein
MGFADFTTPRLMEKVDWAVTRLNAFTARAPLEVRPPVVLPDDREAISAALATGPCRAGGPRAAHIRDTLSLGSLLLSEALLPEAAAHGRLEIEGPPMEMRFDGEGWLRSPFEGAMTDER